jgi:hypothetical protein
MGQSISITTTTVDGAIAAFHTDRSITGQDGEAFDSAAQATEAGTIPGGLADRLLSAIDSIDHVFVASNQVVVRASAPWTDDDLATARTIITDFFVFYADA